jgi:hypothetical protein
MGWTATLFTAKTKMTENPDVQQIASAAREQLELILRDPGFRSSRRSAQFLKYVVEKTLDGEADQIKERTIGVDVFGRKPSYDTNEDHVVRTAAGELRKRLAIYYSDERHRTELRMSLVPGSYIPQFAYPTHNHESNTASGTHESFDDFELTRAGGISHVANSGVETAAHGEPGARTGKRWRVISAVVATALMGGVLGYRWFGPTSAQDLFWKPVIDTPGSVLLAVGDVPSGPPTLSVPKGDQEYPIPIVQKTPSQIVPFGDAVTIARVVGALESKGKNVIIRREGASSFADLREGAVVLVGAFNNEWSLRLTRPLRYSLALDADNNLIYIKDAKNPSSRSWSWATNLPRNHQGSAGHAPVQDYALISRIWNSETGHVVIVIGGLYTYGTEAAGEFLTNPQLMKEVARLAPMANRQRNLQIVLATTVTDDAAGPPRVIAVSSE